MDWASNINLSCSTSLATQGIYHNNSSYISFINTFCSASLSTIYVKIVSRSNHHRCSIKIGVLKNFAKFSGKQLSQSLFFNKVAGLGSTTLLKNRLWHRLCFFSCKFCEIFKNTFFIEYLWTNASLVSNCKFSWKILERI